APEFFPDWLEIAGNRLPLRYRFEPTERDDGITLVVPDVLADRLDAGRLAWLVPGLREEKITEVMRALPKELRKPLVPVPDAARAALADLPASASSATSLEPLPDFHEWLAQWVTARIGSTVTPAQLAALVLPEHLQINVRIVDAEDRVLAEGRNIVALK